MPYRNEFPGSPFDRLQGKSQHRFRVGSASDVIEPHLDMVEPHANRSTRNRTAYVRFGEHSNIDRQSAERGADRL